MAKMADMATNDAKDGFEEEKSHDDIIKEAKAFYIEDLEAEQTIRDNMRIDLRFSLGLDQWRGTSFSTRKADKRPMLVIPRMNEFLNKVKNEQRQNKPSIKVSPGGAMSEDIQKKRIKAAKNRQGLIRHIQYDSRASEAYQTAYDYAVDIGRGWFRILTDYVSPDSFNQEIIIERVQNQFNVVPDRNRKETDYRDMKRCFVGEKLSRERFKADYPDADPCNWVRSSTKDPWVEKSDLWIMEYYCIRYKSRMLYQEEGGETFYGDELGELTDEERKIHINNAVNKREVKEPYIKWYKMTSSEVLEEKDILGSYIPLIPVIGVEKDADGEKIIKGMVRDLRDPQMLYNFWASTEAELLTLAPKAPYVIADGQMKGYEKYWEHANTKAYSALVYKTTDNKGTPVPPPQRVPFAGPPVGVLQAKQGCIDDMRAVTGMYGPSLGEPGLEKSGRAIIAQQRAGDTQTYHYIDNMGIAITHAGRIVNEWLPFVYDTKRIERILGEDGDEETIELGGQDEDGDEIELGTGKFDVVVTMGPSYSTRRQEAAESMMQFMQAVPNAVPLVYDLLVKNMDWPGAEEIAERLKKTIPPEILEKAGGEKEMAAQLQTLTQQVQQFEQVVPVLQKQLEEAMAELEDNGNELAKDLKVQKIKSMTDIKVAQIKALSADRVQAKKGMIELRKNLMQPVKPTTTV